MKITFQDWVTGKLATTVSNMSLYCWAERWGSCDYARARHFPEGSGVLHRVASRPNEGTTCVEYVFVVDIENSESCSIKSLYDDFKSDFPDHWLLCEKSQIIYIMNNGAFE